MTAKKTDTDSGKTQAPATKKRIYQVAKELNLSHEEIITFLSESGISVKSHMSPVDDDVYNKILAEFAMEKVIVEREKSETIQREQELLRKMEQELEKQKDDTPTIMPHEVPPVVKGKKKTEAIQSPEDLAIEQYKKEHEESTEDATITVAVESSDPKSKEAEPTEISVGEVKPKKVTKKKSDSKKASKKSDKDTSVMSGPEIEKVSKHTRKRIRVKKSVQQETVQKTIELNRKRRRPAAVDAKAVDDSIKKTLAGLDSSKTRKKRKKVAAEDEIEIDTTLLKVPEFTSVGDLANLMDIPSNELIGKCMAMGIMVTINQRLDFDTIILLADEYDFKVEREEEYGADVVAESDADDDSANLVERAPIVTIMGHVDHGKTSLLDYIRNENVVAGESGSITQHIGAYRVTEINNREITFLDTPGHEAFTAMRARGAQITDIVILVVAADDGVKPQTLEAISHARAANVPMIVAINKIDKSAANPENVKRELSENQVMVESWGGKVQSVEVSAKTGEGVDDLLDAILLEADLLELKANPDTKARGIIVDAKLDKGYGPIGTLLVQKGTLKIGDPFICGSSSGKVRALLNERGQRVESTSPSVPVQVLGFDTVPTANDYFAVLAEERDVKKISSERQRIKREKDFRKIKLRTLDEISLQIKEGKLRELSIIIKGDADGSVEALSDSLINLGTKEVAVKVIHSAVGTIVESDILLASASAAVVIGFHVEASNEANKLAEKNNIDIRSYDVIYDAVNEVKLALEGLLEPEITLNIVGNVEIRMVFSNSKVGAIAGCFVTSGKVARGDMIRLIRNDEQIGEGTIDSLKRFKDDVKEVLEGFECGITLAGVNDIQEGDIIHITELTSRKRKLEEARV